MRWLAEETFYQNKQRALYINHNLKGILDVEEYLTY